MAEREESAVIGSYNNWHGRLDADVSVVSDQRDGIRCTAAHLSKSHHDMATSHVRIQILVLTH
jgi:hypothetical protein